jgi:subtilase-type serine protease
MRFSTSCRAISAAALIFTGITSAQAQDFDNEFDRQWGLRMIGVDAALAAGLDGKGVLVGVTDSGLDTLIGVHPEFTGRLNGLSFDGSTGGPLYFDSDSHGTHVAGIIAANQDGLGMMGVASGSTIVPLLILGGSGPVTGVDVGAGPMRYGLANGVRIFNASWGTTGRYDQFYDDETGIWEAPFDRATALANGAQEIALFKEVVDAGGVMVFANGNIDASVPLSIEAALPYYAPELERGWLAVTSVGPTGVQASYAQTCSVGMMWCLAAPGGDIGKVDRPAGTGDGGILSTFPVNGTKDADSYYTPDGIYVSYHGTSMAAPHVSGALAIAKQLYPNASYQQLRTLLLHTSTDIGSAGIDEIYGWGLLNVRNMVGTADAAAGTIYAQRAWGQAASLDQIMDSVDGRVVATDADRAHGWWISPFASFGRVDGATAAQEADVGNAGVTGGVEFDVTPEFSLGLFAGGSAGSLRADDGNSANSSGIHGGAVLSYDNKAVFADLTIGVSRFWGNSNRVAAPGLAGTVLGAGGFSAGASSVDTAFWGGAEVGYRFDLDKVDVAPYAFGRVVNQQLGAFGESSTSVLALSGDATGMTTAEVGVGVQLLGSPLLVQQLTITPSLDVAYGRRLGDFERPVSLLGNSLASTVPVGRDVLHIDAALDVSKPESPLSVRLGYSGSLSSGSHAHAVKVSLSGSF